MSDRETRQPDDRAARRAEALRRNLRRRKAQARARRAAGDAADGDGPERGTGPRAPAREDGRDPSGD